MTACMHAWRLFPRGPAATDGFTPGSNSNDDDKMPCELALKKLLLQNKLLPAPIKVSFFFSPPKRYGKENKKREENNFVLLATWHKLLLLKLYTLACLIF